MEEIPAKNPQVIEEHRTRVGRERRLRTREQLLRAALKVIDQQGLERFGVERVRIMAGLSRGSFYSYFPTAEGLLTELSVMIWKNVEEEQAETQKEVSPPLTRLYSYLRYGIMRGTSDLACGRVLLRTFPMGGAFSAEVRARLTFEISAAADAGDVDVPSVEIAVDLGLAMIAEIFQSAILYGYDATRLSEQSTIVLQALGASKADVCELTASASPIGPAIGLRDKVLHGLQLEPSASDRI